MSDALKLCPFCSGKSYVDIFTNGNGFTIYQPVCTKCSASKGGCTDLESAIESWNIRVTDANLEKAIELLQDYKGVLDNIIIEPNSPIHKRTIRLLKEIESENSEQENSKIADKCKV